MNCEKLPLMKYILLLLFFPFIVRAQNAERYEFDSSIPMPGKHAGRIFMRACNVTRRYAADLYLTSGTAEARNQKQKENKQPKKKKKKKQNKNKSKHPNGLVKAHGLCLYEPVG